MVRASGVSSTGVAGGATHVIRLLLAAGLAVTTGITKLSKDRKTFGRGVLLGFWPRQKPLLSCLPPAAPGTGTGIAAVNGSAANVDDADDIAHDRGAREAAAAAAVHTVWTVARDQTLLATLRTAPASQHLNISPAAACPQTSGRSSPAPSRPPSRPRRAGRPLATL